MLFAVALTFRWYWSAIATAGYFAYVISAKFAEAAESAVDRLNATQFTLWNMGTWPGATRRDAPA